MLQTSSVRTVVSSDERLAKVFFGCNHYEYISVSKRQPEGEMEIKEYLHKHNNLCSVCEAEQQKAFEVAAYAGA